MAGLRLTLYPRTLTDDGVTFAKVPDHRHLASPLWRAIAELPIHYPLLPDSSCADFATGTSIHAKEMLALKSSVRYAQGTLDSNDGLKPHTKDGLSLLDLSSSSGSSAYGSLGDGSVHVTTMGPKTPTSIQRKFADLLSPFLGGSKTKQYESKNGTHSGQRSSPQEGKKSKEEYYEGKSRSVLSGFFCASSRKGKKDPNADVVSPMELPGNYMNSQSPSLIFPSLDRLLQAAESCNLPPSPRFPEPGTPNYPTIMLGLSNSLPQRMQRHKWCLNDYTITEKLYKGYASTVYKGICRTSGDTIVLKVYTLEAVCDLYKYQIYREVQTHSALQHENIVHLYASFQEGDKVVLVQEYAGGSDLFHIMHKFGGKVNERLAVQMVLEPFLKVLNFLHSKGIVHRDIKPENIMFSSDMVLKLGDFGLAIDLRKERPVTRAGTLDYMAPEVLRCPFKSRPEENKDNASLHYGPRVDSWALGVLTYEMLVGFPPFFDHHRKNTEERIHNTTPSYPASLSEDARTFLVKSLSKNVAERPTIHEMLHHPWVETYCSRRSFAQVPLVNGVASPRTPELHSQPPPLQHQQLSNLTPTRSTQSPSDATQQMLHQMLQPQASYRSQPKQRAVLSASTSLQNPRAGGTRRNPKPNP
eukprot:gene15342-21429_t